jgi:hypothetical protein
LSGYLKERNKIFERPRHRWENNIKIDLIEIICGNMGRLHPAYDEDQ